jgi:hypothetical protein
MNARQLLVLLCFLLHCGVAGAQTLTVTGLLPGHNAAGVLRTASLSLIFSQAVDPATAPAIQVYSVRSGGKKPGTYRTTGTTVTFVPATPFLPGETVQVTVPATVRSTGGVAATPQCYQFTTAIEVFGGGTFAPAMTAPTLIAVDNGPHNVVVGDIDGDGDLDMLVAATARMTSTISVRVNSGVNSGVFVAPPTNASFTIGTSQSLL